MSFKNKYIKYKTKYLNGKKQTGGGILDPVCDLLQCNKNNCRSHYTEGEKDTVNYKIYSGSKSYTTSYFHGINIYQDNNPTYKDWVNMVIEIPQGTTAKMEINKEKFLNPIMYDIKDSKVRHVKYQAKGSKFVGYPFHYGALPQTWENKGHKDDRTGFYGDNDPIDAFDISSIKTHSGDIHCVKVLGAFAMIDNNETDWKLVCININDPLALQYDDINDVPKETLNIIDDFLTNYKTPDGKGQNKFANKKIWNKQESIEIIQDMRKHWFDLVNDKERVIEHAIEEAKQDITNISMNVEGINVL